MAAPGMARPHGNHSERRPIGDVWKLLISPMLMLGIALTGWAIGVNSKDARSDEKTMQMRSDIEELKRDKVSHEELTGLKTQVDFVRQDTTYLRDKLDKLTAKR